MPMFAELSLVTTEQSLAHGEVIAVPYVARADAREQLAGVGALFDDESFPASMQDDEIAPDRFAAKPGERLILSQGVVKPTLIALGVGSDETSWAAWAEAIAGLVRDHLGKSISIALPAREHVIEAAGVGVLLGSYRFEQRRNPQEHTSAVTLVVSDGDVAACEQALGRARAIARSVSKARDAINEPASTMTPSTLAETLCANLTDAEGVTTEIWDKSKIQAEHLGGLLGVAKGSSQDPRLVLGHYVPEQSDAETKHIVLVGKGVTFDSGGLSLKTAAGMTAMKTDMSGAAIVLSALSALRALGVSVKVSAIAPLTENMVNGEAMKPGDVLIARNGLSMEVLNTDAEGRLILADALCLAEEMNPDVIIDVATLTGAASVALGREMGAVMARPRSLAMNLIDAGAAYSENFWELPLWERYEGHIDSTVADVKNIGVAGEAGTITAGLFLGRFVAKTDWAHLDIAGPGRSEFARGLIAKGGTAFGLLTLLSYLASLSS